MSRSQESSCDETTGLLHEDSGSQDPLDTHNDDPADSHWIVTIILLCGGAVLFDLSNNLGSVAEIAILEDIVCRDYYATSATTTISWSPEGCKIGPIQTEIALLNGWRETFETIPAILLALPYGMLADKIGYRPVALLALFGSAMSANWNRIVFWLHPILPTRAVWLSALWQILGGGPQVVTSLSFSAAATVIPTQKRTNIFSQMTAVILTTELIAPPIGAALMAINPWIPFLTSSGIAAISVIWGVLFFPETHIQTDQASTPVNKHPSSRIGDALQTIQEFYGQLSQNKNVAFVVASFSVALLGTHAFGLLLQYMSKRFHMSYAEASYVLPLRAGTNLISLFTLLPAATRILDRNWGLDIISRDKLLTQASALAMFLGCLLIFAAPTLVFLSIGVVVFGLGASFPVTARTLVTSLVDEKSLNTAYALMSVMSSIGSLVSGPLLAGVYHLGMVMGSTWLGLPFLFAAALYGLALISISAVRVPSYTA
ncbi:major facilitator superfamily domain-containing protein [Aspergillus bertholletiae]|uniref:Major facilitator superfamily domain-containing protein n=1 Tax=Aspergillus bertholletiae TaxID=1226010 RepID=A0A5N7BF87_9EURO|nr:major facilitator superfamily domain-containing protein [Aspergillus bertholletiae]